MDTNTPKLDFGIVREDACAKELAHKRMGTISYCLFLPLAMGGKIDKRSDKSILTSLPLATLEGDGQFKTSLLEAADKNGISLDLRVVCSSFPLMTEVLKQGHIAAILPNIAEVELPAAKFERIQLKLLKSMDRRYVLCFRQRTLERRETLARQLNAFVQLLQIDSR